MVDQSEKKLFIMKKEKKKDNQYKIKKAVAIAIGLMKYEK